MFNRPLDAVEHFQDLQMYAILNEDVEGALGYSQKVKQLETLKQSFDMLMK